MYITFAIILYSLIQTDNSTKWLQFLSEQKLPEFYTLTGQNIFLSVYYEYDKEDKQSPASSQGLGFLQHKARDKYVLHFRYYIAEMHSIQREVLFS